MTLRANHTSTGRVGSTIGRSAMSVAMGRVGWGGWVEELGGAGVIVAESLCEGSLRERGGPTCYSEPSALCGGRNVET